MAKRFHSVNYFLKKIEEVLKLKFCKRIRIQREKLLKETTFIVIGSTLWNKKEKYFLKFEDFLKKNKFEKKF